MTTTASKPNHRQFLKSLSPIVVRGPKDVHRLTPFLNQTVSEYAIDTETTGLHPIENRVRLIQIATNTDVVVVDLDGFRQDGERQVDWAQPGLDNLRVIVQSANTIKVLQNAAFDINMLAGEGLTVGGPIFDTMVASKLINAGLANKNGLGDIVARVLKIELPKELQKADWAGEITDEMIGYAARDAAVLLRLVSPLKSSLVHSQVASDITLYDVFRLEMSCLRAVASMQFRGFNFDKPRAEALRETMQGEAEKLKLAFLEALDAQIRRKNPNSPDIYLPRGSDGSFNTREKTTGSVRLGTKQFAGFNPRSNPQMAQRFKQAGILLPPDAKGNPSLDQNILAFQRKEQPLIEAYLTWKGAATLVSHVDTLIENVASTGRIHANYRQMGTDTGRMSCADPNLQQVPSDKEFRGLFTAAPGYKLLVADFSQVELRVAAHLSREPRMIEAYQAGRDLHTETASLITGLPAAKVTKAHRSSAKICNFGLLYGSGPATLQKQAVAQYGIDMEFAYAKELVTKFRQAYPTLYAWQRETGEGTAKYVLTATGRRRFLVGFNDKFTTRINTRVQGTAGDITKLALANLWENIEDAPEGEAHLIAVVHDEIVMEVREDQTDKWAKLLETAMESAGNFICFRVPIIAEVGVGDTWAEAK
jgi:DNA polymerase I